MAHCSVGQVSKGEPVATIWKLELQRSRTAEGGSHSPARCHEMAPSSTASAHGMEAPAARLKSRTGSKTSKNPAR